MEELVKRVLATDEAKEVIRQLQRKHGELMFCQSSGCCDGSAPMCFRKGDFRVGGSDVLLGEIEGCPFYISRSQFEYWKHTQLIVDVTEGRGASFSLEIPLGIRFLIRSRLYDPDERKRLSPVFSVTRKC
jgi:uncharacterized protein (DUF779 family)